MKTKKVLRDLRKKHGLSQDEMAEKLFVTRQAVSRWETGETVPNTETLKLISKTFGVSINALLDQPQNTTCQVCGSPLDSSCYSREADGSVNDQYCVVLHRWRAQVPRHGGGHQRCYPALELGHARGDGGIPAQAAGYAGALERGAAMKPRIEERQAFAVFGVEKPIGESPSYRDFWAQVYQSGRYQKLYFDAGGPGDPDVEAPGMGVVNAMGNFEDIGDYMIFAFVREGSRTEGYRVVQIPKSTWAIFRGREAGQPAKYISKLFHQAYKRWLPKSGYARATGPDMEIYYVTENGKHRDEIWIPITKA